MDASDEAARRAARGRWAKGHSGNPAGKPRGTRNRATVLREGLRSAGMDPAGLRAVAAQALAGDPAAVRLVIERLCTDRRP